MPLIDLGPLSGRYLSFAEREEIALLRAQRAGVREIAHRLGRSSPSTISRKLRRSAAPRSGRLDYPASIAQWKAELMAHRPRTAKPAANQRLRDDVQDRLAGTIQARGRDDHAGVEGPQQGPARRSAVGEGVEPGTDREPAAAGFPRR